MVCIEPSVRQPLLDRQRRRRQAVGDARAGAAVAVEVIGAAPGRGACARGSPRRSPPRSWSTSITLRAALAPLLPRPDVHRRHAQDTSTRGWPRWSCRRSPWRARAGAGSPPGTCCGTGGSCPAAPARGTRGCPSTCRPSRRPTLGQNHSTGSPKSFTAYSVSSTCCARLLVLGRHRVLHHHQIALREVGRADRRRRTSRTDRSRAPGCAATSAAMSIDGQPVTIDRVRRPRPAG